MMKTILILGGTGAMGTHLVNLLNKGGGVNALSLHESTKLIMGM